MADSHVIDCPECKAAGRHVASDACPRCIGLGCTLSPDNVPDERTPPATARWNDRCHRCGYDRFWFSRTLEPECGSMHYVCDGCGTVVPCGHQDCPYSYAFTSRRPESDG